MADRKYNMNKLEMPNPPAENDEMLELDELELNDETEMDEDMDNEDESPLAEFSDDELLEEVKMRGLDMEANEDLEDEEMDELEDLEV